MRLVIEVLLVPVDHVDQQEKMGLQVCEVFLVGEVALVLQEKLGLKVQQAQMELLGKKDLLGPRVLQVGHSFIQTFFQIVEHTQVILEDVVGKVFLA